ncbi:MAG: NUDIX hydrolase [Devosia sp.]
MYPRLATRALIVEEGRLLLVNAYADGKSDLWCAPGGGVEAGSDIPSNLKREVYEETGLTISVGGLVLLSEFHDPSSDFHQVDLFFRARIEGGRLDGAWMDPDAIVTERQFFSRAEMGAIRFKPTSLPQIAFGTDAGIHYDALEPIVV